ncbi:MAG: carbohydrate porin [Synechococcus lacustris]
MRHGLLLIFLLTFPGLGLPLQVRASEAPSQLPTTPPAESPPPSPPAPLEPAAPWLSLQQLLDLPDWVQFGVQLQAEPMANPSGGTQQTNNWVQQIVGSLSLGSGLAKEQAQWSEWDHWHVDASLNLYSGNPFYFDQIGAAMPLQQVAHANGLWLTQAQISRSSGDGWFGFKGGILSITPDFIYAPVYDYYIHSTINNSLNISLNDLPVNPLAAAGGVLEIKPSPELSLRYGLFDLASTRPMAQIFGVNPQITVGGTGLVQLLQLSYSPDWLAPAPGSALPVCVHGSRLSRLGSGCQQPGSIKSQLPGGLLQLGGYSTAYSSDGEGINGSLNFVTGLPLGLDHRFWIGGNYSFDTANDPTPVFVSAGFLSQGLIPSRPFDVFMIGLGRTGFNSDISPSTYEGVLELGYQVQLNPTLNLQPAVQWIFNPGGTGRIPGIFATTLQLTLNL